MISKKLKLIQSVTKTRENHGQRGGDRHYIRHGFLPMVGRKPALGDDKLYTRNELNELERKLRESQELGKKAEKISMIGLIQKA